MMFCMILKNLSRKKKKKKKKKNFFPVRVHLFCFVGQLSKASRKSGREFVSMEKNVGKQRRCHLNFLQE